ncbi:MAG TPA: transcriptional regulator [Candidatus Angelobacter sp.]
MNHELKTISSVDRVLHEPGRMLLAALLYAVESADFLFLLNESGMTRGNLSSHLARLEEAGYVEIVKSFRGKIPHTLVQLTEKGRSAFDEYRAQLRTISSSLEAASQQRP